MNKIKVSLILVFLCISAVDAKSQIDFTAGLALPVGYGYNNLNPGVNLSIEPLGKVNNTFDLGAHFDYSWMSAKTQAGYSSGGGYNFWDISLVPKFLVPIKKKLDFFFDVDPGFCIAMKYYEVSGYDSENGFSMTYQAGFNINQVVISFKMKSAFINDSILDWANFNIGFKL